MPLPPPLQSRTHCTAFLFNVLICLGISLKILRERCLAAKRLSVSVGWRFWMKTAVWVKETMLTEGLASMGHRAWWTVMLTGPSFTLILLPLPLFPVSTGKLLEQEFLLSYACTSHWAPYR